MAKARKAAPTKSQAERLLEIARKAQADQSRGSFSRTMGKTTLARNARKTSKGQVGG
jgi:hypothetical protein